MKNKDIKDYPLNKIQKMRSRDRALKIIFTPIIIILIFSLGFGAGFHIARPANSTLKAIASIIGLYEEKSEKKMPDAEAASTKVPDTLAEEKLLKELTEGFVKTISEKYPEAEASIGIKNLDTGAAFIYNDKAMNSASVIKLFVMETVFTEAAAGRYELTPDRKDDLSVMISKSDNKATNRFIEDFGDHDETRKITDENLINATIKKSGYKYTQINRKVHDTTPPEGPTGYENYTSSSDVITLLEGIYKKEIFENPYNGYALNYLKNQERRGKIPQKIAERYPEITVANKTGELSQVENDVAIIMSDDFNLVFTVFIDKIPKDASGNTNYKLKEQVQETIADLGLELVEFYKNNSFK